MTVCIAAVFRWFYGENDLGWAVIGASDRMLTSGDVEYEPPQTKFCSLTGHVLLLTAGAMHIHSEAIRATQKHLQANEADSVGDVAEAHASNIGNLRARFAAQEVLSPFGLDHSTFLAKQREMDPELVMNLANKIIKYSFDIECIVFGVDSGGNPDIFHIDGNGIATRHIDVGFVSIGIGADHANLQLMAAGYSRFVPDYYHALGMLYAAKKSAEVAPAVGRSTDIQLITRHGWESIC